MNFQTFKLDLFIYLFLNIQAGFRKGRGTRDQIANICWNIEKAREFQKTSASLTSPNCVDHNKVENS